MSVGAPAAFAHASEAEMGRILDFYDVRWQYEPRTFPILWNQAGEVVESFSPDFYLPDLDLFLEMTTLKQRLVRKKNRKIRRLRELYPDIRIKLFYARDFRALMLKYGRMALAEQLSGLSGQVLAEREESPAGLDAGLDPGLDADPADGDLADATEAVAVGPGRPVDGAAAALAGAAREADADAVPSGSSGGAAARRRRRRRGRQQRRGMVASGIEAGADEEAR